jgi:uncharacterized membrane protein YhaH (DUF805 family)
MKYYILAIQNYGNMKVRSRLSEYWVFTIFIFLIISFILDYTNGTSFFGAGFGQFDPNQYSENPINIFVIIDLMHS